MKKFFRITYYSGIGIIFVLVTLVGYTQTRGFRSSLQDYILSHYHSVLSGKLTIGRIEGNLITGIRLYDVSFRNADTALFTAERIEINHDPVGLFFKRVSLGHVTVVHPRIALYRSPDGRWNIDNLFVSSRPDTSASAWTITARNIELVDARISVVDSVLLKDRANGVREAPPPGVVDYAQVALDSVDLAGGLQMKPGETSLQLRHFSFAMADPGIHLRNLEGEFTLTKNGVSASNVKIVTDHSRLAFDVSMARLDIAKLGKLSDLKTKPVNLDFRADNLDTRELKQFLYPWVDFLDKDLALQVQASGEFGRLEVEKALVETPQSRIALSGTITNLHKPEDLELDILSSNSVIEPAEIESRIPGLMLPNLGTLGKTRLRVSFQGRPTDFESTVRAQTEAGSVEVSGHLTIDNDLVYKTSFRTNGLDLGQLLDNTDLQSSLTMNGTLTGMGTDAATASAVARVEIDSSEFWGMPFQKSAVVLDLSDATLRAHSQLRARSTEIELTGVLRFPQGDSVHYTLNGAVNALNLADVIRNSEFTSDLSFSVKASGTGTGMSLLNNVAAFDMVRSSYGTVAFDSGTIAMSLDLTHERRSAFTMRSAPLDLDVEGQFTLPDLVENVIRGERIASDGITHRFQTLDSLRGGLTARMSRSRFRTMETATPKIIDCRYRLEARDLVPVGVFFQKSLSGSLSMDGSIKGSIDSMDFTATSRVQSFEYRNRTDSYRITDGTLSLGLEHIARTGFMNALNANLDLRSHNLAVNNLEFRNTVFSLHNEGDSASYQWSALIDSAYQLDLRATSQFASNIYTFNVSQVRVGMDFYIAENSDPVVMKLGSDGLFIDNLVLSHEVEELGVNGYFDPAGKSDLKIAVNDFLMNNLKSILMGSKLAEPVKELNGILNASLTVKGPLADPDLSLDLTANGFRSRDVVFGQVVARSSYANHLLSMFVELRNKTEGQEEKPDLLVSGTVPYQFGVSEKGERLPQGDMNLTLFSKGLNLAFLEPLLPAVSNLSGTLVCDMKIRGSVDAPTYEGSLSLQGARLLFKPLGLYLLVQGKLIPSGTNVGLENFMVRNDPRDRPDGQMKLSGTFSLAGLSLREFNLKADGQLLVMKESSRLAGQKFYGDLFLGTGPSSVRWQGEPSDSRVTGDLVIRSGRITFPPEREVSSMANSTVNVIFRDDTSKTVMPAEDDNATTRVDREQAVQYASLDPLSTYQSVKPGPTVPPGNAGDGGGDGQSFLDHIAYDLNIDVQSPTSLAFVFNTQPSEELFADLRGRLTFVKSPSQTRLTGEMNLESRSYYYFFKRFEASGKIDFTGDPINPELNVTATYEGIHTLDTLANGAGASLPKTVSGQPLTSERVDVLLQITGTKNRPKTKFSLEFPDRDKNSQYVSKDPDGDAMSFLLTGYLKDELDPQQRGSFVTANMLSSLTAGLITGPLTNALKKQISAIQSVDLQYYGGDWNKTDVRVTAEISSAVIRFGGRVIEGINNTNVSVEVPVGSVFGSDRWRNLLFKYERKVDAVESIEQRTQSNSLSLFYRIIF